MSGTERVTYTARTITTGGREKGVARSVDGLLDIRLSPPGSARIGTNPEQLFAAAWSASFESALTAAARRRKIPSSADMSIEAEVDLSVRKDGGSFLCVRFNIKLPSPLKDVSQELIAEAKMNCPYSQATHGNVAVFIELS